MQTLGKSHFTALIEHLRPFGDVLQVGFSHLYIAAEIQKYLPKTYTILENRTSAIQKAHKWAQGRPTVQIIEESWQNSAVPLQKYDAILFSLIETPPQLDVLEQGKGLLKKVEDVFPGLDQTRYTEGDLDAFCSMATGSGKEFLPRFLKELEDKGQISSDQRAKISRKYELVSDPIFYLGTQEVFLFFKRCLDLYMRPGARFACFLGDFSFPLQPGCQQRIVPLKGIKALIAEKELL